MKNLEEKFWMTEKQILEYAKRRDDLWEYEDEYLLDFIRWNQHGDLDDILDEFSHYWIEEDKAWEEKEKIHNMIDELYNIILEWETDFTFICEEVGNIKELIEDLFTNQL